MGGQHHGFCPLPNHNGKRNSPSFSANLKRGIFQCFGCGAKGNLLEFAALMEKADIEDGQAFRGVAVKLKEKFCTDNPRSRKSPPRPEKQISEETIEAPVIVNAP